MAVVDPSVFEDAAPVTPTTRDSVAAAAAAAAGATSPDEDDDEVEAISQTCRGARLAAVRGGGSLTKTGPALLAAVASSFAVANLFTPILRTPVLLVLAATLFRTLLLLLLLLLLSLRCRDMDGTKAALDDAELGIVELDIAFDEDKIALLRSFLLLFSSSSSLSSTSLLLVGTGEVAFFFAPTAEGSFLLLTELAANGIPAAEEDDDVDVKASFRFFLLTLVDTAAASS